MEPKKPTSYKEQLRLIKDRGCIVENDSYALGILADINYYRLGAYFLPFRADGDKFLPGTSFDTIIKIYEFDRKLRNLLFALMEGLETRLRTRIAYLHAHKYGPLGYLDVNNFNSAHKHTRFQAQLESIVDKNSKTPIVRHHNLKYAGKFPIWVMIELFTFGMLSTFYSDMLRGDQKEIAKSLFGRSDTELKSWLYCLTFLRNACAHYSQLYYTQFLARPAGTILNHNLGNTLFDYILIAKALCEGTSYWSDFLPEFLALMRSDGIYLEHMGFPCDWDDYFIPQ